MLSYFWLLYIYIPDCLEIFCSSITELKSLVHDYTGFKKLLGTRGARPASEQRGTEGAAAGEESTGGDGLVG